MLRPHARAPALRLRQSLRAAATLVVLVAVLAPARAQEAVRVGVGFGLAFLPIYLCEELQLIEKHGKDAHLDLKAIYQRFPGAGPLQEAIRSGAIDMGPFGIAPLLAAWERGRGTPRQVVAISGITTMPLALLTNRPNVHALADFRLSDLIAMPSASAPQMYFLQMQAERTFGQYDRLRSRVVVLPHPDAVAALIAATGPVTAYFSSPPYTQIALKDERIHKMLSSSDAIGGKASFLIMGGRKDYAATHPSVPEAIEQAIAEAARIIRDDPRRAAQIYLAHEPSKTLDLGAVEGAVREIKDEFGTAVYGVQAFSSFMARHEELKSPPQGWKEIVAPALLNSPST